MLSYQIVAIATSTTSSARTRRIPRARSRKRSALEKAHEQKSTSNKQTSRRSERGLWGIGRTDRYAEIGIDYCVCHPRGDEHIKPHDDERERGEEERGNKRGVVLCVSLKCVLKQMGYFFSLALFDREESSLLQRPTYRLPEQGGPTGLLPISGKKPFRCFRSHRNQEADNSNRILETSF